MLKLKFFFIFAFLCFINSYLMELPEYNQTYQGGFGRGFWFTSPENFRIIGLRVPTDIGFELQSIEIIRFNSIPPEVTSGYTTDYVSLGYWQHSIPTDTILSVNYTVAIGDMIGVFGQRAHDISYGKDGEDNFETTICGLLVTITRIGFDGRLFVEPSFRVWQDSQRKLFSLGKILVNSKGLGRVEMYYCQDLNCLECSSYDVCSLCEETFVPYRGDCISCSTISECKTCSSIFECTECNDGFFLLNGDCTSDCQKMGAYYDDYSVTPPVCTQCEDKNCDSCTSTECTVCLTGYFLDEGYCLSCKFIEKNCIECDSEKCYSCRNFYHLLENVCYLVCPNRYYNNGGVCSQCENHCSVCTDNNTCLVCEDHYYSLNGDCYECESSCARCENNGTFEICYECEDLYYLFSTVDGNCHLDCTIFGAFFNDDESSPAICAECDSNCNSCLSEFYCIECDFGYFLSDGSCIGCGDNCDACFDESTCVLCGENFYLFDDECINDCTELGSYFNDDNRCAPCMPNCEECSNLQLCTLCIEGREGDDCEFIIQDTTFEEENGSRTVIAVLVVFIVILGVGLFISVIIILISILICCCNRKKSNNPEKVINEFDIDMEEVNKREKKIPEDKEVSLKKPEMSEKEGGKDVKENSEEKETENFHTHWSIKENRKKLVDNDD